MNGPRQYFFPRAGLDADLSLSRFQTTFAYLAATYHNVFTDVFGPAGLPEQKETFRLFPAMMLFRHAIELLLKAVIEDICEKPPPCGHDLSKLLDHALGSAKVQHGLGEQQEFVETALHELQECDRGDGFRYGQDRNGNVYFTEMPKAVNVGNVFNVCERLWQAIWRVHGPCR